MLLGQPTQAGLVTYPPGATFGPRASGDFELVWIIEGQVEYRRDQAAHPCPAESIVLCIPGHTDFFRWDPRRSTRHAYLHFDLQPGHTLGDPEGWPVVRPCEGDEVIRPLFRHLLANGSPHDRPRRTPAEQQLVTAALQTLLYAFVLGRTQAAALPAATHPPAVERALAELRRRLALDPARRVKLHDLASAADVTPEHLCRLFRRHTGRTPAETVRLARLDRAAVLLCRSNYTVGEIAGLCGFASQFHFSRAFKAAYGTTPTHLRERVLRGETPPVPRLLRTT